jgi:hypothetical protein
MPKSAGCGLWAKSLGKSRCDVRDMPTVAPTIARISNGGELEAELWQNMRDLENQFLYLYHHFVTLSL